MSSHTLDLTDSALHPVSKPSCAVVPIHAALSSEQDVFALLWEYGRVEIYDLHTRIGPGRGKALEPEKLWTGDIGHEVKSDAVRSYTQVIVLCGRNATIEGEHKGHVRIAILGADIANSTPDVACVVTIRPDRQTDAFEVELPSRNGRLLSSGEQVVWQAPLGDIFDSTSLPQSSHPSSSTDHYQSHSNSRSRSRY